MQKLKDFFADKTVGFYLSCAAAVLSLVVGIVYGACYAQSVYLNSWGVALPIVGAVLFLAAVAVKVFFDKLPYVYTVGVAVMWVLDFIGFMIFINASYLYLSEVFYSGFSMKAIGSMKDEYIVCILFFIVAIVLSNVGLYLKGSKPAETVQEVQE